MNISGNPLLSLLGGAPAAEAGTIAGLASAQSGFGAMVAAQAQSAAQLVQGPKADLPLEKIAGLFQKIETILNKLLPKDESAAVPTAEEAGEALVALADVLGTLNTETKGKLFEQFKQSLSALQTSGEIESTPLSGTELVAALVEIARVVKRDVAALVKSDGALNIEAIARVMPQIAQAQATLSAATQTGVAPLGDIAVAPGETTEALAEEPVLSHKAQSVLSAIMSNAQQSATGAAQMVQNGVPFAELPKELIPVVPHEIAALVSEAPEGVQSTQAAQSAQAARANEATAPRFATALMNQVRGVEFREGVTKIELTPRGLGNIEIELKTSSDGALSVVVRAENAHVLNSLREERSLLADAIAGAGESSVEFQEYEKPDQQGQGRDGGYSGSGGQGAEVADSAAPDTAPTATIGGGHLDMMT
ncbi:flagellar hook-length control protein FliK [Cognatishimia sp. SS12]|uniref:flagellar hook-length control protein FliK n=1 Tax=Cognatishimia sp. SS12 TaxID=2979465 RepID=UPI00232CA08F|nr:flagellar hook-length control protein FliK [Cognatishimia sp. SS12]MDC0739455.1 flagellar hook-length control protein FliK [Cognatishimia sp. SS12]